MLAALCAACAAQEKQQVPAETGKQEQAAPDIDKDTASRHAAMHLALKNWSWGEPESVVERDGKFYVYYKTPERELRLVGARVLIVDGSTGLVTAQKRR